RFFIVKGLWQSMLHESEVPGIAHVLEPEARLPFIVFYVERLVDAELPLPRELRTKGLAAHEGHDIEEGAVKVAGFDRRETVRSGRRTLMATSRSCLTSCAR